MSNGGRMTPTQIKKILEKYNTWEPIESAPKDGTLVWLLVARDRELPEFIILDKWDSIGGWCVDLVQNATHWMLFDYKIISKIISQLLKENEEMRECLKELCDEIQANPWYWDHPDYTLDKEDSFLKAQNLLTKLKGGE